MANLRGSLSEFLQTSRVLIENARTLPEIASALEGFGYTAERFAVGVQLLSETEALVLKQTKEYGESYEATESLNTSWTEADNAYVKTLKIARLAFGDETKASAALKLYGTRKQSVAGWLDQAQTFYGNLIGDKTLSDRLTKFGYGGKKIADEAALVEIVHKKLQTQAKESGEAQQATVERDKKVAELDSWVSELRAVAKVAFSDNLQELEKLGIMVLNAPRAKKKAEPVAATVQK